MSPAALLSRWPATLRALHWTMAALLPVQAALGWYGERSADRALGRQLLGWHYELGVVLLALLVLRIGARLAAPRPPPPARAVRVIAAGVQLAMYALLLALPVSGYVIWVWMDAPMAVFGVFELPTLFDPPADDERGRALAWYVHVWGAWSLAALVTLHVAAAAWHRIVEHRATPGVESRQRTF